MPSRTWTHLSAEESEQIKINRERASYKNPFHGKNMRQRYALHGAFNAMASVWQKLGMR
jgi:hypothetical protein